MAAGGGPLPVKFCATGINETKALIRQALCWASFRFSLGQQEVSEFLDLNVLCRNRTGRTPQDQQTLVLNPTFQNHIRANKGDHITNVRTHTHAHTHARTHIHTHTHTHTQLAASETTQTKYVYNLICYNSCRTHARFSLCRAVS